MASFDKLTSSSFWENVLYLLAGYMAAKMIRSRIEGNSTTDVPDEAYGVAVIVAGSMFGGNAGRMVSLGGGLHTGQQLARRVGVSDVVNE